MSRRYTETHLQSAIYHAACARLEEEADGRQHSADILEQVRKLLVQVKDEMSYCGATLIMGPTEGTLVCAREPGHSLKHQTVSGKIFSGSNADIPRTPDQVPFTVPDSRGNRFAREGLDRCFCGCKYWEDDRCTDCGTHVNQTTQDA